MKILNDITRKTKAGKKMLAVLIDPDKFSDSKKSMAFIKNCEKAKTDYLFLGGSLLTEGDLSKTLQFIKANCKIPVILFPGDSMQIHSDADALLFLSLISGRNADLLIGKHVVAAPFVRKINLEAISTGYMMIESGNLTTAGYISQSLPIPGDKPEIAVATALAGEMLGMKLIYADGGSGAKKRISSEMIQALKINLKIPLIIGGGIKSFKDAEKVWEAGADILVIGTAFEKNAEMLKEFSRRK